MGVGRFICVSLPFILTLASLICILIITLNGVTSATSSTSLYLFKVNTQNLSVSASDLSNLDISNLKNRRDINDLDSFADLSSSFTSASGAAISAVSSVVAGAATTIPSAVSSIIASAASSIPTSIPSSVSSLKGTNITAADLDLPAAYTISLWNFCSISANGSSTCTPASFDWATNTTTNVTATLKSVASAAGVSFTPPVVLTDAVNTFSTLIKWTEILYIIAGILTLVSLIVGLFGFCSRMGSCCTFLFAGVSTLAVGVAATLATVTSAVVVGAVDTFEKFGVSASFNTGFLALAWLAVAFALGGSLFWLFTICCCAPDRHERRNRRDRAEEKAFAVGGASGAYQRVVDPFAPVGAHGGPYQGQDTGYINNGAAAGQKYEPYSHAAV